ncbi:MAG TPA: AlkA N-terminal domain-containing protein [Solirubrobacteraceae bacterium]|jgi:AraC family transcriptional regulator of adaptative response / DNA-3-methyladenine glycosylase II|nr:AlkA N-terminal domain-containing protein [Solirubrobacteraceae bacterium]
MFEDFDSCYRAAQSRDARFDGWFFTAVSSTGIYCRPSCPAVTPKRENVSFFATAAAAQRAGYRACLRCRPDAAPGSPEWLGRADVAARAVKLILDGAVDREGVDGLARRLGYSERQLHRVLIAEVGAGALSLARAQRAQTARLLLQTTDLPIAQVAFGAGFASVRQFNDTVRAVFARTPTELRKRAKGQRDASITSGESVSIPLLLAYRSPLAAEALHEFLALRAIPGVEAGERDSYRRSLRLAHGNGTVELRAEHDIAGVRARFVLDDLRDLTSAIARCRHLLNLDADPVAIDGVLGADPLLRPLVASTPGLRVPGSADGFELAVRAVVGQQISVAGARTVIGTLVSAAGEPLRQPNGPITHTFPTPDALATLARRQPDAFAMPAARRRTLAVLAEALAAGELDVEPGTDPDELRHGLLALPGIGPWTAGYIAMRALGQPDAFLASDLGVRRSFARLGESDDVRAVAARAERWRPWRAYAVAHLWRVPPATKPVPRAPARARSRRKKIPTAAATTIGASR